MTAISHGTFLQRKTLDSVFFRSWKFRLFLCSASSMHKTARSRQTNTINLDVQPYLGNTERDCRSHKTLQLMGKILDDPEYAISLSRGSGIWSHEVFCPSTDGHWPRIKLQPMESKEVKT